MLWLAPVALLATVPAGYRKIEYRIPMRDGVKLYTAVYVPEGRSGFPLLMERSPYSSGPYGANQIPSFGGDRPFVDAGYAFVFQDVRGQYQSEGEFVNVRPQLKTGQKGIDESTDTYDTVDFLVKNVKGNNGKVGMRGISYPGFYAGVGALSRHPALKAVSPQAPVTNWFLGDDVHHNGAFFIQDNFGFSAWFDTPRKGLENDHTGIDLPSNPNGPYGFYLDGVSAQGVEQKYFKGKVPYWNELIQHDTYDQYWKDRALELQMKNVKCAVLTVGGWFDAEDLWGALNLYSKTELQNAGIENKLVMGPWSHGQWAGNGRSLSGMDWGSDTSAWFRENVEFPFFNQYLNGGSDAKLAEATMFETGKNVWRTFMQWPPKGLTPTMVYLGDGKGLASKAGTAGADSYVNDPNAPTPYLANPKTPNRPGSMLAQDETWASKRADVLTYVGQPYAKETTYAGPIGVDLWVTTTGSDGDFIVKVLDIAPDGEPHAGEMRMVRCDVLRGRFRNSMSKPEPIRPGVPTRIKFNLNDVLHTYKPGHRMAVQVQSSWFPLVDRNPNRYVNIRKAKPSDFQKATIRILRGGETASSLKFGVLP